MAGFHPPARLDEPLSKMEEIMQNVVRRILGFVTQLVSPAPADTAIADEAWWQGQIKEIKEQYYQDLGNWWMEEVPGKCISCPQPLRLMRWQTSGYGDQCDRCISHEEKRYEADESELKDAMSVKISF